MRTEKTALQFYKEIERERKLYRLVNGLLIVKYIDKEICQYVGEFLKAGTAFNECKTNKVIIQPTEQKFKKNSSLTTNARGDSWKPLTIEFNEKPIKEILK